SHASAKCPCMPHLRQSLGCPWPITQSCGQSSRAFTFSVSRCEQPPHTPPTVAGAWGPRPPRHPRRATPRRQGGGETMDRGHPSSVTQGPQAPGPRTAQEPAAPSPGPARPGGETRHPPGNPAHREAGRGPAMAAPTRSPETAAPPPPHRRARSRARAAAPPTPKAPRGGQ
ncbi:unnamed protein product, partial [Lampetra planeri]